MKRVIVLSWFKTIVDRLFGPDEDNNKVELEYEETENEIDESLNKIETKEQYIISLSDYLRCRNIWLG